jgi:trans-aconitate methyltransferase
MDGLAGHWDAAYAQGEATRSWFEAEPLMSLRMLDAAGVTASAAVIDVGGGTSRLADALLARGCRDVTVLDISRAALQLARDRLGPEAARVHWVTADIGTWTPGRRYDAWHDRAVLHFLTSEASQSRYLAALRAATRPGSAAVIGCFSPDGPAQCSGLPVARRSAAGLAALLGPEWTLTAEDRELHPVPGGGTQPFTWAAFTRA